MFQAWKLEQEQLQQEEEKSKKTKNDPKGKQQEAAKQADSKKGSLSAGHKRGTADGEKGPEAAPPVGQGAELHPGEEPFGVKETLEFRFRTAGSL